MEHLRSSPHARSSQVPYLCQAMYDCEPFDTYYVRMKWDLPALSRGDFKNRSEEEAVGFLQSWMYFGLLWDFFGSMETFNLAEFISKSSAGAKVVSTAQLPHYIGLWHQVAQDKTTEQRSEQFLRTKARLRNLHLLATRFCMGVPVGDGRMRSTWHLPLDVSLSIQVLADTLQHAGHEILRGSYNIEWGYSPLLKMKMRREGWCPRAIATCTKGQQIHNLYYASTLEWPSVSKTHEFCDEKVCQWEQTDVKTYLTQHREGCPGTCSFIKPKLQALVSIYAAKGTPLVYFKDTVGAEAVEVLEVGDTISYVAVSHVWSDGLGNQHENALPLCQLKFLQKVVNQLRGANDQGPSYWWCDTLCVPVSPNLEEHRTSAIRNMKGTYQNAKKVLILDRELMSTSVQASVVELCIRVKLSSWARRLWTLQESHVSTAPVIQFKDGIRSIAQLYNAVEESSQQNRQFLHTRYAFLCRTFFAPFIQSRANHTATRRFIDVWKQLQWRATSHQCDEPLCLATITNIDPGPILAISSNDTLGRMVRYLTLLERIPYVLLVQPPPRLAKVGFRWAPASMLNCFRDSPTNPFRIIPGIGTVKREGDGLLVKAIGAILSIDSRHPFEWDGEPFFVEIENPRSETHMYRVQYLFSQDQVILRNAVEPFSGQPVIVFLEKTLAGWLGMLGEVSGTSGSREHISVKFVAIVTLGSNSQGDALPSETLEDQIWLMT